MFVIDSVLFFVAAYLLLIPFGLLLRHVCCWFGSVGCCGMSVVDSILFVVSTCLLLIRFWSLLPHVCCWFDFVRYCHISIVDPVLFVVAASHVAASVSAWSCAIPHKWVIQWVTVWPQKVDSDSASWNWDDTSLWSTASLFRCVCLLLQYERHVCWFFGHVSSWFDFGRCCGLSRKAKKFQEYSFWRWTLVVFGKIRDI
jgi:hypothetical protein